MSALSLPKSNHNLLLGTPGYRTLRSRRRRIIAQPLPAALPLLILGSGLKQLPGVIFGADPIHTTLVSGWYQATHDRLSDKAVPPFALNVRSR